MGRLAKPISLKRLMMIDLPIVGFMLGALLSLGANFSARTDFWGFEANFARCQAYFPFSQMLAERFSILTSLCSQASTEEQTFQAEVLSTQAVSESLSFLETAIFYDRLRYNVQTSPPFYSTSSERQSPTLDHIIDGVIQHLQTAAYPIDAVSISLVDLTGICCEYGQFQDRQPRYPASISKLFWLVALYGQYEAELLQPNSDIHVDDEALMAHYSNNGASSRVLDAITQTQSGDPLSEKNLVSWVNARRSINDYFHLANYSDLNLAHKTFPIPDVGLDTRQGRDLQLLNDLPGKNHTVGDRNYLSTFAVARLLYEIDTGQAISQKYSDRIKHHLKHSTDPVVWQSENPNAIAGFFGEYLPADTQLYTKLGFTFDDGRQEAAIIASPDNTTRFILVVFANDSVFSNGESKIFPEIARYVYDQMQLRREAE